MLAVMEMVIKEMMEVIMEMMMESTKGLALQVRIVIFTCCIIAELRNFTGSD